MTPYRASKLSSDSRRGREMHVLDVLRSSKSMGINFSRLVISP